MVTPLPLDGRTGIPEQTLRRQIVKGWPIIITQGLRQMARVPGAALVRSFCHSQDSFASVAACARGGLAQGALCSRLVVP